MARRNGNSANMPGKSSGISRPDPYKTMADSGVWGERFDAEKARKFAKLLERMTVDNDAVADLLIAADAWMSGWCGEFIPCLKITVNAGRELDDVFAKTVGATPEPEDSVAQQHAADAFALLSATLNRYLSNHTVPDAVIRDVLLSYTVSYQNAAKQTVDSFLVKFWNRHNDCDVAEFMSMLRRYAFAFGYAEKIKHLMAKGKYAARNDAAYKDEHVAYRNALALTGKDGTLPELPAGTPRPEAAWSVLDAYQTGMKVRPGLIPTEISGDFDTPIH